MRKNRKLKSLTLFDIVNYFLVAAITFIIAYPLYFCIVASFSDPMEVAAGNTLFWVKDFTLKSYENILKETKLWTGYRNTIIYTFFGTLYNLVLTIPAAYVLTKKYLPFHGVLSWYFFIPMFIGGGTIPTYLLMKDLGLVNNPLVMIVGVGVSTYNLLVTRQYFATSIHPELYDAAYIDGASEWVCFKKVAFPLAKPIVAVMALYYGVGRWNSYYNALIYIYKEEFQPLQLVLRSILINNSFSGIEANESNVETLQYLLERAHAAEGMKYSIIFVASAPLLIAYPFIQKYFAKGIMLGSVKG